MVLEIHIGKMRQFFPPQRQPAARHIRLSAPYVPAGTVGGLTVGLIFLGPKWSERLLLKAGYAYEQASGARVVPQYGDEPTTL